MFQPDYCDMLKCLNAAGVNYLVVGGYAVMSYGYVRTTGDLDIWILPDAANAEKTYVALRDFGAPLGNVSPQEFARPGIIFQIGIAPCRIDIITQVDGLDDFKEVNRRARTTELGGVPVRVISLEDLFTNKLSSGRAKDLADVEELRKVAEGK